MTAFLFSQNAFNSYYFTYWLLSTLFDTGVAAEIHLYIHVSFCIWKISSVLDTFWGIAAWNDTVAQSCSYLEKAVASGCQLLLLFGTSPLTNQHAHGGQPICINQITFGRYCRAWGRTLGIAGKWEEARSTECGSEYIVGTEMAYEYLGWSGKGHMRQ